MKTFEQFIEPLKIDSFYPSKIPGVSEQEMIDVLICYEFYKLQIIRSNNYFKHIKLNGGIELAIGKEIYRYSGFYIYGPDLS